MFGISMNAFLKKYDRLDKSYQKDEPALCTVRVHPFGHMQNNCCDSFQGRLKYSSALRSGYLYSQAERSQIRTDTILSSNNSNTPNFSDATATCEKGMVFSASLQKLLGNG